MGRGIRKTYAHAEGTKRKVEISISDLDEALSYEI